MMEYKVVHVNSPNKTKGVEVGAIFDDLENAIQLIRVSLEKGRVMQIEARKVRD